MGQEAYKMGTYKRYISNFKMYYNYCIKNNYNPWYYNYDIKYWCSWLLYRVRMYSLSILSNSRRGITYMFIDLLGYSITVFRGAYYKDFITKLNKTYDVAPDARIPILVYHHRLFIKYYKVTRNNAWSIDLDILLLITIDQLYGFCGRRCGEFINNQDPITIDQLEWGNVVKQGGRLLHIKYAKIIHKKYKNQINKKDYMYSIFGASNDENIDPYWFLYIYVNRRRFMKTDEKSLFYYKSTNPLFVFKNGTLMKVKDVKKKIISIYRNKLTDDYIKGKIDIHGFRIGINVAMEERGFTQGQIMSYIGWIRNKKDKKTQAVYSRMLLYWKVCVIKSILTTEISVGGIKLNNIYNTLNKNKGKQ